jgi:hypothetical protein
MQPSSPPDEDSIALGLVGRQHDVLAAIAFVMGALVAMPLAALLGWLALARPRWDCLTQHGTALAITVGVHVLAALAVTVLGTLAITRAKPWYSSLSWIALAPAVTGTGAAALGMGRLLAGGAPPSPGRPLSVLPDVAHILVAPAYGVASCITLLGTLLWWALLDTLLTRPKATPPLRPSSALGVGVGTFLCGVLAVVTDVMLRLALAVRWTALDVGTWLGLGLGVAVASSCALRLAQVAHRPTARLAVWRNAAQSTLLLVALVGLGAVAVVHLPAVGCTLSADNFASLPDDTPWEPPDLARVRSATSHRGLLGAIDLALALAVFAVPIGLGLRQPRITSGFSPKAAIVPVAWLALVFILLVGAPWKLGRTLERELARASSLHSSSGLELPRLDVPPDPWPTSLLVLHADGRLETYLARGQPSAQPFDPAAQGEPERRKLGDPSLSLAADRRLTVERLLGGLEPALRAHRHDYRLMVRLATAGPAAPLEVWSRLAGPDFGSIHFGLVPPEGVVATPSTVLPSPPTIQSEPGKPPPEGAESVLPYRHGSDALVVLLEGQTARVMHLPAPRGWRRIALAPGSTGPTLLGELRELMDHVHVGREREKLLLAPSPAMKLDELVALLDTLSPRFQPRGAVWFTVDVVTRREPLEQRFGSLVEVGPDNLVEPLRPRLEPSRGRPRGHGRVTVSAVVAPSDVVDAERVVAAMHARLQACYEVALGQAPDQSGRFAFRLVIGPDGAVSRVDTRRAGKLGPEVEGCMKKGVSAARFQAPSRPRATVSFTATLTPG